MTTQAQAFQAPQNHAALKGNALRQSYRYHNPLILTADQVADLAVLSAWNAIADEMAQALPTPPPYRKPLALLRGAVPMQQIAPITLAECWTPIIPALDIPSLPPVQQGVCVASLIETQTDLLRGHAVSPSCKENLIDGWLEGQASMDEVIQAHKPKQTYTQHLVRRAYAVLSFVGGYARLR